MYDRAHDGFTATLHGAQWATGALAALLLGATLLALLLLLVDTLTGTLQNTTRTLRLRRTWRRSGRTPSR